MPRRLRGRGRKNEGRMHLAKFSPCRTARRSLCVRPRQRWPTTHRGEVAEWLNAPHSKCGMGASPSGVRIPPSPPLSCSEPEMRLPPGAFFFLFQRRLAETPEPRRLAPGPISVSNSPPSLTERTSSGPVRLREGQRFQPVPPIRTAHLLLGFSQLGVFTQRTRGRRIWGSRGMSHPGKGNYGQQAICATEPRGVSRQFSLCQA